MIQSTIIKHHPVKLSTAILFVEDIKSVIIQQQNWKFCSIFLVIHSFIFFCCCWFFCDNFFSYTQTHKTYIKLNVQINILNSKIWQFFSTLTKFFIYFFATKIESILKKNDRPTSQITKKKNKHMLYNL